MLLQQLGKYDMEIFPTADEIDQFRQEYLKYMKHGECLAQISHNQLIYLSQYLA